MRQTNHTAQNPQHFQQVPQSSYYGSQNKNSINNTSFYHDFFDKQQKILENSTVTHYLKQTQNLPSLNYTLKNTKYQSPNWFSSQY